MGKFILHENEETGGVCVMMPNLACGLTIEEIAKKDVVRRVYDENGDIIEIIPLEYRIVQASNYHIERVDAMRWSDVLAENDEDQVGLSSDQETGKFSPPDNDDQSVATSGL